MSITSNLVKEANEIMKTSSFSTYYSYIRAYICKPIAFNYNILPV